MRGGVFVKFLRGFFCRIFFCFVLVFSYDFDSMRTIFIEYLGGWSIALVRRFVELYVSMLKNHFCHRSCFFTYIDYNEKREIIKMIDEFRASILGENSERMSPDTILHYAWVYYKNTLNKRISKSPDTYIAKALYSRDMII